MNFVVNIGENIVRRKLLNMYMQTRLYLLAMAAAEVWKVSAIKLVMEGLDWTKCPASSTTWAGKTYKTPSRNCSRFWDLLKASGKQSLTIV